MPLFYTAKQIGFTKIDDVEIRISKRKILSDHDKEKLIRLGWNERYDYTLQTIVKHQEIWTSWNNNEMVFMEWGGYLTSESDLFSTPIFPHKEIGVAFFDNDTEIDKIALVPIPIDDFIDEIVSQLEEQNGLICIFPTSSSQEAVVLDWGNFIIDLAGYWENEYGTELQIDPAIRREYLEYCKKKIERRQMKGKPKGRLP